MNRTPDRGQAPSTRSAAPRDDGDARPSSGPVPGQGAGGDGAALPSGYQMLRRAGTGRHSTVYLCREEATGHEVAVKLGSVRVPGSGKRLAAHSELLAAGAAARHPCAVTVEDAGFTADKRPYVVTAFCRGGNAQSKLTASGPFPVEDAVAVGVRLALALHSSHLRGVLHLDVRPANILYDENGDALLSDHGVARVLQRCAPELGAVFDPMYSSRELFGWEAPGPAADVYSLGATLYALLAGEPAYSDAGRTGWAALYHEVLKGELPRPERPGVPEPLFAFLRRMMSADPENRPPLTEVHRVLRALLPVSYSSKVPDLEPEPSPPAPLPGWDPANDVAAEEESSAEDIASRAQAEMRRRNRNRFIAAAAVLVVFAGAATALLLTRGGGGGPEKKPSASPGEQEPEGTGGGSGKRVPEKDLPGLRPRGVAVTASGSNVQVAWRAPEKAGPVTGYLVTAQSPDGEVLSTKNSSKNEPQMVFTAPPVGPGSCYIVMAVVETGAGLQVAPAKPVCDER